MNELRVYMVEIDAVEEPINCGDIVKWSDEKFINESEKQGLVYTIEHFQTEWNEDNLFGSAYTYIRILTKNTLL